MSKITVKQAAERVGVSESLIYQWCQDRRLPHLRLGKTGRRGKILILVEDFEAFLAGLKVEAGETNGPAPALRHITQK
jgi:excisionase family DNA binding protein